MRVSLGETTRKFRKRNLATGVSTSEARRQEAEYAEALQGMRSTGMQDTARIQEEGAMNRLMAAQEFEEPLQDTQVEAGRLSNKASRFANIMGEKYGEGAIRADLGHSPIKPRANVFFPERTQIEGARSKSDIFAIASPSNTTATIEEVRQHPGGLLQGWSRAWDRSSKTPVGRMLGLPAINWMTQKGFEGLDIVGKGMKGVFDKAFTPMDDTPALPDTARPIAAPPPAFRPVPKRKKKFTWRDIH